MDLSKILEMLELLDLHALWLNVDEYIYVV